MSRLQSSQNLKTHGLQIRKFRLFIFFLIVYTYPFSKQTTAQKIAGGTPFIQNYNNKNAYTTSENQHWAVLQDDGGIMYFGNNSGVLEFDGIHWRLIELPNKSVVRSLALDENGRIYVGAKGEFGYLAPDSGNTLQYVSLIDKLPEVHSYFEDVWRVFCSREGIIFHTFNKIYIYTNDTFKIIEPETKFHLAVFANNQFYVNENNIGLKKLNNYQLQMAPNGEEFRDKKVYQILPYNMDDLLVITRSKGLFIYSPENNGVIFKDTKLKTVDNFIRENQGLCATYTSSGSIVFGTLKNGIIVTKNGKITEHVNKKLGLEDNTIWGMALDRQGNVFAAMDNGIAYLVINSPFRKFDESNGLQGICLTSTLYQKNLFVGTSQGIFYNNLSNSFSPLTKDSYIKGYNWQLKEIEGNLYSSYYNGICKLTKSGTKGIVENIFTWKLLELQKESRYVLAGTRTNGFLLLMKDKGQLVLKDTIKGFNSSARWFEEDSNGAIWVSHYNKGIYRLKFNSSYDSIAKISFFDKSKGLPSNTNNYVLKISTRDGSQKIVFGTENGIYSYDKKRNFIFRNDSLSQYFKNKGFINQFVQDKKGNIYFQQDKSKGVLILNQNGGYKLLQTPFLKLEDLFCDAIYPFNNTEVLFCSPSGLFHYNSTTKTNYDQEYTTLIRQVSIGDSILYGGSGSTDRKFRVKHSQNNFIFTYSSTFFEEAERTLYSFKLENFDKNWSGWTSKTEKEYTNLPEGNYNFMVKAKNLYQKESSTATYSFSVAPPFFRSSFAIIGYIILLGLLIRIVVKLNIKRLEKEKEQLELIVKERTVEVINQKEEIEAQAEELKTSNEKLIELDQFKQGMTGMIVHDLKNPLNAILNISKSYSLEKQNQRIKQISRQTLNRVLNILDVYKYEETEMILDKQDHSLNNILQSATEEIAFLAESKNILIKIEILKQIGIFADKEIIERVLVNILSNAIKYTPNNGNVSITIKEKLNNDFIFIAIKDNGLGIPQDQIHKVFDKFWQVSAKKSGNVRSTGLGLTFCKMAIEAHGGEIGIKSEENIGTTCWFTLQKSNTKSIHPQETVPLPNVQTASVQLSSSEKEFLKPYTLQFKKFKIYEISALRALLKQIDQVESDNIKLWKEEMNKAMRSGNNKKFSKLLNYILEE